MPKFEVDTSVPSESQGELVRSVAADAVAIWSGEWEMWWRDDAAGYTRFTGSAGVYTRDEAHALTRHCGPEKKIEIKPHPYAGCNFYQKEASGAIMQLLRYRIRSECGKYDVQITYELSTNGLVVHSVEVI
jgi:hypothetical protein